MTDDNPTMSREELLAYVAAHESEDVQRYVEALYEEQDELKNEIDSHTRDLRPAERPPMIGKLAFMLLAIAVTTLAFFIGRLSAR
ncbi:MAG: hypothetical protein V4550_08760 [Gemmatimonadota bacterium]